MTGIHDTPPRKLPGGIQDSCDFLSCSWAGSLTSARGWECLAGGQVGLWSPVVWPWCPVRQTHMPSLAAWGPATCIVWPVNGALNAQMTLGSCKVSHLSFVMVLDATQGLGYKRDGPPLISLFSSPLSYLLPCNTFFCRRPMAMLWGAKWNPCEREMIIKPKSIYQSPVTARTYRGETHTQNMCMHSVADILR